MVVLPLRKKEVMVVKASGDREPFNSLKLQNSLLLSGATPEAVERVIRHIRNEIQDGTTTDQIHSHALFLLRKIEKPSAARYSLRRAIVDLGPSGFPFEKFVAEIFHAQGFTVLVDQQVKGYCTEHEIDVVAYSNDKLTMAEVKFHHEHAIKSDLKIALYVKARFDDLRKSHFNYGGKQRLLSEGYLITNTKFTKTAITYAMCAGVTMIGWNYPVKGNLHDLIEDWALHPITCLTSLNHDEKNYFLEKGIVLCSALKRDAHILRSAGFPDSRIRVIREEIENL